MPIVGKSGYDANTVLDEIGMMGAEAVIPPKRNRKGAAEIRRGFYKERHGIECFFGKLMQFRLIWLRQMSTRPGATPFCTANEHLESQHCSPLSQGEGLRVRVLREDRSMPSSFRGLEPSTFL